VNAESCVDVDVLNVRYCTTTGAEYFSKPKPNKEQILLPAKLILPLTASDCFLDPPAVIDPPPSTPIETDLAPPTDSPVVKGTARLASTVFPNVRTPKKPKTTNDDAA
jgi:hypothetical protein